MKLSAHQGFGVDWEPDYKGVAQGNSVCMDSGGGYTVATHMTEQDAISLSLTQTHTLKTHKNCLNSTKASCFLKNTVSHRIFHCMDRLSLCWGSSGSCGHWLSCSVVCGILVPWQGVEPVPPAVEAQSPNQGPTGKSLEACVKYHSRQPYMNCPTNICKQSPILLENEAADSSVDTICNFLIAVYYTRYFL